MERTLTIREWSPEERPREKVIEKGIEALDAAELLTIIIGSGTAAKSALDLSREVLHRFGGVDGVARASVPELMRIKGIGEAKAVAIVAAFELCRRRQRVLCKPNKIKNADEVANYFRPKLMDLAHEEFWALFLDFELGILAECRLGSGDHRRTMVDVRKLFQQLNHHQAHTFIVVHNHPSGSLRPSCADHSITESLKNQGLLMGYPLRDHIIISREGYFSFSESGLLKDEKPQEPQPRRLKFEDTDGYRLGRSGQFFQGSRPAHPMAGE
jgi:DNA repair protein RadC